jgi:hypothetical protein
VIEETGYGATMTAASLALAQTKLPQLVEPSKLFENSTAEMLIAQLPHVAGAGNYE